MAKISNVDFYALLGVHPNAEDIVIRAAFKALAQRYHPDRFKAPSDDVHRRMADLTNAYETLSDPARRRKYDRRRGLSEGTPRFYFKNPARDKPQRFGLLAARAAAAKQRQYRVALYALMGTVIVLSAFNIYQYSPQIRSALAGGRGSAALDVGYRATPVISVPVTAEALSSDGPAPATTTNIRILPFSQGGTRAIVSRAAEAPTPLAVESSRPPPPPSPAARGKITGRPVATETRQASVAPAPPASVPTPSEGTRAAAKPTVVKAPDAGQPESPRPAAAAAPACAPNIAALGLCNTNSTAKGN